VATYRSPVAEYLSDDLSWHGPALVVGSSAENANEIDWQLAVRGFISTDGSGALHRSWREQANHYPGVTGSYTTYMGLLWGSHSVPTRRSC
jgi:hypothetical protein